MSNFKIEYEISYQSDKILRRYVKKKPTVQRKMQGTNYIINFERIRILVKGTR